MNARDIITKAVASNDGVLWVNEVTESVIDALRADPAAVLSLLPGELLADIRACANWATVAEDRYERARPHGDRVLDVLAQVTP